MTHPSPIKVEAGVPRIRRSLLAAGKAYPCYQSVARACLHGPARLGKLRVSYRPVWARGTRQFYL